MSTVNTELMFFLNELSSELEEDNKHDRYTVPRLQNALWNLLQIHMIKHKIVHRKTQLRE